MLVEEELPRRVGGKHRLAPVPVEVIGGDTLGSAELDMASYRRQQDWINAFEDGQLGRGHERIGGRLEKNRGIPFQLTVIW